MQPTGYLFLGRGKFQGWTAWKKYKGGRRAENELFTWRCVALAEQLQVIDPITDVEDEEGSRKARSGESVDPLSPCLLFPGSSLANCGVGFGERVRQAAQVLVSVPGSRDAAHCGHSQRLTRAVQHSTDGRLRIHCFIANDRLKNA